MKILKNNMIYNKSNNKYKNNKIWKQFNTIIYLKVKNCKKFINLYIKY